MDRSVRVETVETNCGTLFSGTRARGLLSCLGLEKEEKGNYGELQLAVCKRKYEGAELRYSRPKPAAVNANSLSFASTLRRKADHPFDVGADGCRPGLSSRFGRYMARCRK